MDLSILLMMGKKNQLIRKVNIEKTTDRPIYDPSMQHIGAKGGYPQEPFKGNVWQAQPRFKKRWK